MYTRLGAPRATPGDGCESAPSAALGQPSVRAPRSAIGSSRSDATRPRCERPGQPANLFRRPRGADQVRAQRSAHWELTFDANRQPAHSYHLGWRVQGQRAMPCVVESGLEAREADSFEYRRAALDRLRDRGLLSEREHRRWRARARASRSSRRARAAEEAARAGPRRRPRRRRAADAERARERLRGASCSVDHLPSPGSRRWSSRRRARRPLPHLVAKAIVIQKYWRGCFTRKTARRRRVAAQAIVIQAGAARRRGGGRAAPSAPARGPSRRRGASGPRLLSRDAYRFTALGEVVARGGRRRAGRARGRAAAPAAACAPQLPAARGRASPWARRRRLAGAPRGGLRSRASSARRMPSTILNGILGFRGALQPSAARRRRRGSSAGACRGPSRRGRRRRAWPRAATAAPGRRPRGPRSGRRRAGAFLFVFAGACRCAGRPCPAARRPRPWFALAARDAFERACSRDAFSALAAFERACCCSLARSPAQQCVRLGRSNSMDARRRARTITANGDKRRNASRGR